MSRNSKPEETHQLILQVAKELFIQKGYENTSLNDIISHLGGLTKGAIYHHYHSKDEILKDVITEISGSRSEHCIAIRDDQTLTGKEKLEKLYHDSIIDPNQSDVFQVTPQLLDNPVFLTYYIKQVLDDTVPNFMIPILREGVADGSIKTDYPDELAEMIIFLSDMWMNPIVKRTDDTVMAHKVLLLQQVLAPFNICIFDKDTIEKLHKLRKLTDR